ncbi:MAG: ABC transporter permease, partial [Muribaculaceae bacterium]|nr:ABC transporter permease [Muribaculaceae bacterium]
MTTSPVWRLLRRNISPWQLAGYALANLVGLAIVLTAIQFFTDVNHATSGDDDNRLHDYLVVSKSIGMLNRNTAFGDHEI